MVAAFVFYPTEGSGNVDLSLGCHKLLRCRAVTRDDVESELEIDLGKPVATGPQLHVPLIQGQLSDCIRLGRIGLSAELTLVKPLGMRP